MNYVGLCVASLAVSCAGTSSPKALFASNAQEKTRSQKNHRSPSKSSAPATIRANATSMV